MGRPPLGMLQPHQDWVLEWQQLQNILAWLDELHVLLGRLQEQPLAELQKEIQARLEELELIQLYLVCF
jgi:hypothetical protein